MYILLISIKVYSFIVKDKKINLSIEFIFYLLYILALDFKAFLFKSFLWWA